jgi:hypothetical protein
MEGASFLDATEWPAFVSKGLHEKGSVVLSIGR